MEKSLQATENGDLRRIPRKRKSSKSRGLWRESRPFSCHPEGSVLENSTACVYVETLVRLRLERRINPVSILRGGTLSMSTSSK
jgi:hypothetical protein